jgi:hypothetical protein
MNGWPIVAERSFLVGATSGDFEARSAGISGHVFARLVDSVLGNPFKAERRWKGSGPPSQL